MSWFISKLPGGTRTIPIEPPLHDLQLNANRPLKAWLFRVSYNRCLDELRKQQRQQLVSFSQLEGGDNEEEPLFAETIPDGQPTPEELLEQQEAP